jgi:hypothetical protein
VPGVLDKEKQLLNELTIEQSQALIADGTISGGMIPKVETCVAAVEGGVGASVILDGKIPHVMLLEIFTQRGVGTLFKRSEGKRTGAGEAGRRKIGRQEIPPQRHGGREKAGGEKDCAARAAREKQYPQLSSARGFARNLSHTLPFFLCASVPLG